MERRATYIDTIDRRSARRRILVVLSIAIALAAALAISCSGNIVTNVKSGISSVLPSARYHLWGDENAYTTEESAVLKKPATPTIHGFIFRGWAYDSAGVRMVSEGDWNKSLVGNVELYAIWDVAEGYHAVNTEKHIAYASLASAIAAASFGDTIRLAEDTILAAPLAIKTKSLTLDLAGYTLSAGSSLESVSLIAIDNGGDLTITDSVGGGKIDASSLDRAISIEPNYGYSARLALTSGSLISRQYPIAYDETNEMIQLTLTGGSLVTSN